MPRVSGLDAIEQLAEMLVRNNIKDNGELEIDFRGESLSVKTLTSKEGFLPIIFHFMKKIDEMSHGGKSEWLDSGFSLSKDENAILGVSVLELKENKKTFLAPVALLLSSAINDFILNPEKNLFLKEDNGTRKIDLFSVIVDIERLSESDSKDLFSIHLNESVMASNERPHNREML